MKLKLRPSHRERAKSSFFQENKHFKKGFKNTDFQETICYRLHESLYFEN